MQLKTNKGKIIFAMDTMSEGHVTPVAELVNDIDYSKPFHLMGYDNVTSKNKSYAGINKYFGIIIYDDRLTETLLSYKCLLSHYHMEWTDNGHVCNAISMYDTSVVLRFTMVDGRASGLPSMDATHLMKQLCNHEESVSTKVCTTTYNLINGNAPRMQKWQFQGGVNVLSIHHMHHLSLAHMELLINCAVFKNGVPFAKHDIKFADQIRNHGPCIYCALAKAKFTNKVRKKRAIMEDIADVPSVRESNALNEDEKQETMGSDRYFIEGISFLMSVGLKYGYIQSDETENGTKKVVGDIVVKHVQEYINNRMSKIDAYNANDDPTREVDLNYDDPNDVPESSIRQYTSDSEHAIVNSAIDHLSTIGIQVCPKPSGKHVCEVEVRVGHHKRSISATRMSIPYKLNKVLLCLLVQADIVWMNFTPRWKDKDEKTCPYLRHKSKTVMWHDIATAPYGVFISCPRPGVTTGSPPNGELCVYGHPIPDRPGTHRVYSVETGKVKDRHDFTVIYNYDGVTLFGAYKYYIPPPAYARNVMSFNKSMAVSKDANGNDVYTHDHHIIPTDANMDMTNGGTNVIKYEPRVQDNEDAAEATLDNLEPDTTGWIFDDGTGGNGDIADNGTAESKAIPSSQDDTVVPHDEETVVHTHRDRKWNKTVVPSPSKKQIKKKPIIREQEHLERGNSPTRGKRIRNPDSSPNPSLPRRSGRKSSSIDYAQYSTTGIKVENMADMDTSGTKTCRVEIEKTIVDAVVQKFGVYLDIEGVTSIRVNQLNFKAGINKYGMDARVAIHKELKQMIEFEVFVPVNLEYNEVNYMRTHDLMIEKLDGTIKARFVAGKPIREYHELDWGIDLYSPTVDSKVIFLILSMAIENDGTFIEIWDVRGAFLKVCMNKRGLYAKIDKFIADTLIEINPEWKDSQKIDGSMLVELKKAWYGTAAASALWYEEISSFIETDLGYTKHPMVQCLFCKDLPDGTISYIMLHVDDMCITISNVDELNATKKKLEDKYGEMRVQDGDDFTYVGIECHRNRKEKRLELGMETRIERFCEEYNITEDAKYPADDSLIDYTIESEELSSNTDFRSIVMSMRYMAQIVRPDILFPVSFLSCNQEKPTVKDMKDARRIAGYLKRTKADKIYLYGIGKSKRPIIQVYADSSWRIFEDNTSQGGTVIFIGDSMCAMYSSSKKIKVSCHSSSDAELIEFYRSTYIAEYFYEFMKLLGFEPKIMLMQDNDSSADLVYAGKPAHDKKRKHINEAIISTHKWVNEYNAEVVPCITKNMYADHLTKVMMSHDFKKQKDMSYGRREQHI